MSIKNRIIKLEKKLLPSGGKNIEVIVCEVGESVEHAYERLGIDPDDGEFRIVVVFD